MESMQRNVTSKYKVFMLIRAQVNTEEVFGRSTVELEVNRLNKGQ
jgi:hypothetical protein